MLTARNSHPFSAWLNKRRLSIIKIWECFCRCLEMEHGTSVCLLWSPRWRTSCQNIKCNSSPVFGADLSSVCGSSNLCIGNASVGYSAFPDDIGGVIHLSIYQSFGQNFFRLDTTVTLIIKAWSCYPLQCIGSLPDLRNVVIWGLNVDTYRVQLSRLLGVFILAFSVSRVTKSIN